MDILRESSFAQYLTQQAREEGIEQGLQESIRDVLEIRFGLGAAGHFDRTRCGHR